jgi:hypothetical protein
MRDGSRYIFVGGLHRSGTTPLTRVLAAHPEIGGLTGTDVSEDEGQHLQDVYPRIRAYGGMGRFANADAAHLTSSSCLVTQENADRLATSWSPFWDSNKRYLLEKSPGNMIMGGFLQALFPGSGLIVVIRHPIAVALAMQKWNPLILASNGRRRATLSGLVRHWLKAHEVLRTDAAQLDRLHVLRYEDLVLDPVARLADIRDFLGLETAIDSGALRGGMSDRYQQQWDAMGAGRLIKARVRASIESRYGASVADYGYDITRIGDVARPLDTVRLFGR